MSNKEPLEFDDLNPRPRDLDDAAAQQVLGGFTPCHPGADDRHQLRGKQPKAVTWFKNLFKKNGG